MDVIDTEIQDFWVDRSDTTCWTSFQIALSKLWLECPEARDDIDRLRAYVAGLKPSEFGMDADRTMVDHFLKGIRYSAGQSNHADEK